MNLSEYPDTALIVERRHQLEKREIERVDLTPQKQYELYKKAVSPFVEGQNYKYSPQPVRFRTISDLEQAPENDRSARRMSISDIEMASKGSGVTSEVTEAEVVGSIRGSSGHDIALLVNQFMLAAMAEEPLPEVASKLPSFNLKVLPILDEIFNSQAMRQYWNDPERHSRIRPTDVVDFIRYSWRDIRKLYHFRNFTRNRKLITDGEQYNSDWVQSYWYDNAQAAFEERIFEIERNKVNAYIENPLFDGNPYLFIPLSMHPDLYVATEEDARKRVNFGDFAIQFTGRIDYHLRNPERDIYIDKKFGSYDSLRTEVTEAQVLAYCYALSVNLRDYSPYTSITPANAFFYDDWYDITGQQPNSYLVDLTIPYDRLDTVRNNLARYCKNWYDNNLEYKRVKGIKERAFIVPFLG